MRLVEGIKILRGLARNEANPSKEIEEVEAKVKELQHLYSQLEALREGQSSLLKCDEILRKLVQVAHSLTSLHDIRTHLSSIPNSGTFGPEAKASLPEIIGKLGRYYASCSFLIAAARKLPIFRRIHVESIRLPVPEHPPSPARACQPSLMRTVARIVGNGEETLKKPFTRSSIINQAYHHASAEANFISKLAGPRKSYRIHAEIQLLFFYEIHSELLRPRVICSSKSACFLCDLFIEIHATYFVARTHGVLYNKWTLPDPRMVGLGLKETENMAAVVEKFSASIEDSIRSALAMPRLLRFHPNESVFMAPSEWSASALSRSSSSTTSVTLPQNVKLHFTDQGNPSQSTAARPAAMEGNSRKFGDEAEPLFPQLSSGKQATCCRRKEEDERASHSSCFH